MRWTTHSLGVALGLFVLGANIQPAAAQERPRGNEPRAAARAHHEERDNVTNALFTSSVDEQGQAVFTTKLEDFTLEKAVAPTGDTTIRLTQGTDTVSIAMNHGGYLVARGKKTVRLDSQSGTQEDADAIRGLLLGSRAVRTFRRLSASLESREDDDAEGPLFLSALVDGAVVELLDGDAGASHRVGKRITRKRRASMRPAGLRPANLMTDCVLNYEQSLVEAWDLNYACTDTALNNRFLIWWGAQHLCELEFMIRSQQYIYQFITCLAYPF